MVGKRIGFGKEAMTPHSLTMTMIGASLLWFGWFGFNAGSALEITVLPLWPSSTPDGHCCSRDCVDVCRMAVERGKPSMLGGASGAVAGLVAITRPAVLSVSAVRWQSVCSGVVCLWGVHGLKRMLGADDALDVFGVHGVGGILGALLTGVFADPALGGGIFDYVTNKMARWLLDCRPGANPGYRSRADRGLVGSGIGGRLQAGGYPDRPACAGRRRARRSGCDFARRTRIQPVIVFLFDLRPHHRLQR